MLLNPVLDHVHSWLLSHLCVLLKVSACIAACLLFVMLMNPSVKYSLPNVTMSDAAVAAMLMVLESSFDSSLEISHVLVA